MLGALLVVASVMMCILSHRLYKVSRRYNKEKLDDLVREHRRKFGRPAAGERTVADLGGGAGGLFRMAAPAQTHMHSRHGGGGGEGPS